MADPISAAFRPDYHAYARPAEISDLLSYQLISGAITGYEDWPLK